MPATPDAISSQVFVLPSEQRMALALALMESVETDNAASANEAWFPPWMCSASSVRSRQIDEPRA